MDEDRDIDIEKAHLVNWLIDVDFLIEIIPRPRLIEVRDS